MDAREELRKLEEEFNAPSSSLKSFSQLMQMDVANASNEFPVFQQALDLNEVIPNSNRFTPITTPSFSTPEDMVRRMMSPRTYQQYLATEKRRAANKVARKARKVTRQRKK